MSRRAGPSIPAIAVVVAVVIAGTGLTVLLGRLVTDSWVTGGVVGAVAGVISAIAYPRLARRAGVDPPTTSTELPDERATPFRNG